MRFSVLNILLLFLIILSCSEAKSQEASPIYEINYHYGFILPHHKSFEFFIKDQISVYEFNIAFPAKEKKDWQIAHKYPELGIGALYGALSNPKILGNALSAYAFINKSIIRGRFVDLYYKFKVGAAYLTKKFDIDDNIYNVAIGSHLNVHVGLSFNLKFKIGKHFDINTGLGFTHFSNGAVKTPNKGINLVTVNAGLRYCKKREKIPKEKIKPDFEAQNDFCIVHSVWMKQNDDPGGNIYLVSSLVAEYIRQFSIKHGIGAGIDLFYDQSLKNLTVLDSVNGSSKKDYLYPGVHVSYNHIFGKTTFLLNFGAYLFNKPRTYQNIFFRFGLRRKMGKHILLNLSLKTYFAAADFAEIGVGYYW